ncbi:lipoxygenase homology domain-containing protein 1-like [Saccostrea echinata]|uniref:lipoxygenase homology domain-containing protein 1-like n=1 Tax=Saccostrea echinata TaxID=191078 RepID=UPI002A81F7B4|nr:lipoxygenase homology domain-containing protein 1-like [Saccostrea echinata]
MTIFHIKVTTGRKFGGATQANVYITLHGDEGSTGRIQLRNMASDSRDDQNFQLGKTDEFIIESNDRIGKLSKITIGHDNLEAGVENADWFLEKVEIACPQENMSWHFPCHEWLAMDKGDGKIERGLHPRPL